MRKQTTQLPSQHRIITRIEIVTEGDHSYYPQTWRVYWESETGMETPGHHRICPQPLAELVDTYRRIGYTVPDDVVEAVEGDLVRVEA